MLRRTLAILLFTLTLFAAGRPKPQIVSTFGHLPLSFEVNRGQAAQDVKYLARGHEYNLLLKAGEADLSLRGTLLRMRLVGASRTAPTEGLDPLPGRSNYLLGNDPSQWRTGVQQFGKVEYRNVYPGVDLVYYGREGQLEYDFVLAPGADPRAIRLDVRGADRMTLDAGDLVLTTASGDVRLHNPVIYQERSGKREPVAGGFVRRGRHGVAFQVAAYDRSRPLVIDPTVSFLRYLGGNGDDRISGMAVDASGNIYVTGSTTSTNFPTTTGAPRTTAGGQNDAYVTKLSPDGKTILYSTYLGGSGNDYSLGIALGSDGSAYLTGFTDSPNFPTANAFQSAITGTNASDAFVLRLDPTGGKLLFSTYLGGGGADIGNTIAVGSDGSAYVFGSIFAPASPAFPTKNPFQTTGTQFLSKFSATGSLVYSSFFGGSSGNVGGITVDATGDVYLVGQTSDPKFPVTTGAYQTKYAGAPAFLTKINAAGSAVVFSTLLGGTTSELARSVALDSAGNIYVGGETNSTDFPVVNATQAKSAGSTDAFISIFNPAGSSLLVSTYFGGSKTEHVSSLRVLNSSGGSATVLLSGTTNSTDLPVKNATQSTLAGSTDMFYAVFDVPGGGTAADPAGFSPALRGAAGGPGGANLKSCEYYGSPLDELTPWVCEETPDGGAVCGGSTNGALPGTTDTRPGGTYDGAMVKVNGVVANPAGADLQVTQSYSTEPQIFSDPPVQQIRLVITVKNNGPSPATGLVLTNTLPPEILWRSGESSLFCSGDHTTCQRQSLAPGESATAQFLGDAPSAGPFTSSTQVTSAVFDPNSSNNASVFTFSLTKADVAVSSFSCSPSVVDLGQPVSCTLVVVNNGSDTAMGAYVLMDTASKSTVDYERFTSATASAGKCTLFGAEVGCRVGDLAPQTSVTISATLQEGAPGTPSFLSVARAASLSFDPNLGNNDGTVLIAVNVPAKPAPTVGDVSPASATAGQNITISGTALKPAAAITAQSRTPVARAGLDATVKFNGTVAAVLSNNGTQIVTVVPAGATSGPITVTTAGGTATSATSFTVTSGAPPANLPVINTGGVVNAASFSTHLAPGSLASAFGIGLATSQAFASSVPLPTTLGGGTLQFNDPIAVPTIFASPNQSNFQIPWELPALGSSYLTTVVGGLPANPVAVTLWPFAPAIFTTAQTGGGQGVVQIANTAIFAAPAGSIQGVQTQPAKAGVDYLTIYCTGLGPVTNRPASGAAAPSNPLASTLDTPIVTIGGVAAPVSFSGLTPGFVGLYQVNVQVPAGAPTGDAVPLIINMETVASNTVTIAVQ